MSLGRIDTKKKSGMEPFHLNGESLSFNLLSFWQWSSSDLVDNALRGKLAEFIVGNDVGCVSEIGGGWDAYDLLSPEGIKIEIKTGGYLQSWSQKELSTISFGVQPTYGWDAESNTFGETKKRQSGIYVFCVLAHKDKKTVDPLNIKQWEFYVLPTCVLNHKLGNQKTIILSSLLKLNPKKVKYGEIGSTIRAELLE